MTLAMIVYLLSVIPKISAVCFFLLFLVSIAYLGFGIGAATKIDVYGYYGEDKKEVKEGRSTLKMLRQKVWIPFTLLAIAVLAPGRETLYTMVAAYGVEKVVENPVAQDLAGDGVEVLKAWMAKAKKDLSEDEPKKSR